MWTIPMPLVTVEDEGGHLWATADVEGLHMGTTAHIKGRHMWATPMDMVDDEGHKLLEACYGNPIGGKGTFGATSHPNTRIVAQSTLDYFNNRLGLSYKLVRVFGATWTFLGPFRSKYLISMEIAESEEHEPTKYFVRTYERFIMGADSSELNLTICVPWDDYLLTTPKPLQTEWLASVTHKKPVRIDLGGLDLKKIDFPKPLQTEWLASLTHKKPVRIDLGGLDLKKIDFERLKQLKQEISEAGLEVEFSWEVSGKQDPKEIAELQEKMETISWEGSGKQDPKEIAELQEKMETSAC